ERKRRVGFTVRHLEADHGRAVLLLERLHLTAGLDHDHAQRPTIERGAALDDGIDDALGLSQRDRAHCAPPAAVFCHLRGLSSICGSEWRLCPSSCPLLPLPPSAERATSARCLPPSRP